MFSLSFVRFFLTSSLTSRDYRDPGNWIADGGLMMIYNESYAQKTNFSWWSLQQAQINHTPLFKMI